MTDARQVESFICRYTPEVADNFRQARNRLSTLVPNGYELVYDNYNALAIGFAPSLKPSEVVVSIAAYPRWVTLFFMMGAALDDPLSLLEGSGAKIRSIRLQPFERLASKPVQALLRQALKGHAAAFRAAPALTTVVKSISANQRARRPAEATAKPRATSAARAR